MKTTSTSGIYKTIYGIYTTLIQLWNMCNPNLTLALTPTLPYPNPNPIVI